MRCKRPLAAAPRLVHYVCPDSAFVVPVLLHLLLVDTVLLLAHSLLRLVWSSDDHADTGYYLLRVLCLAHVFDHTARVRMHSDAQSLHARVEHLMDLLRKTNEDVLHLRTVVLLSMQNEKEEEEEEGVVKEEEEDTDAINPSPPLRPDDLRSEGSRRNSSSSCCSTTAASIQSQY